MASDLGNILQQYLSGATGFSECIIMGFYRLILSYVVALSHAGVMVGDLNPGEIAVVSFLLLSGYVMTALVENHYSSIPSIPYFYGDRAIRLFPQFLLYSVLTIILAEFVGLHHSWMNNPPTLLSDLIQLTMLPLNLYPLFPNMLLPQGWSLGLELTFYAVIPFVLIFRIRFKLSLCSFFIFFIAYIGILNANWFAYRLLPGTFFIFMLGSYIRHPGEAGKKNVAYVFLALAILTVIAFSVLHSNEVIKGVLLGLMVGIPLIYIFDNLQVGGKIDSLAGDLSYGVFLNHNILIPAVGGIMNKYPKPMILGLALLFATLLSYISFSLIEKPLILARRLMRNRGYTRSEASEKWLINSEARNG